MAKAHLFFGIIVFIVFLITGRFMRADFPDKEIISQEFRLLMRSRHIYILLSSFIHILLGLYIEISTESRRKFLQISGSIFLFAGTILLIYAFFYETYTTKYYSDLSRFGLYTTLSGTILHLFGKIPVKSSNDQDSKK